MLIVVDTNTGCRVCTEEDGGSHLYEHPRAHTPNLLIFFPVCIYHKLITFNVSASINNPMRSSLKKPKNKETASVASAASKKSVRIALGEEQTAV